MDFKKQTKQSVTSKEIRDFAQDVYDYVWSKQYFFSQKATEKFAEGYCLRNSSMDELKDTHFTESIGKAVRLSQFLLRDYFANILEFTIKEKHSFKKEVKLMWSNWLDNRTNIFVKVIDTLAIVAEIFLFCDCNFLNNLELGEVTEWFIEWFDENLASEFFKCGGWKNLAELASKWYDDLFERLNMHLSLYYTPKLPMYVNTIFSCKLIECLRLSPVEFPVPAFALCDNCRLPTDPNLPMRTVYIRLEKEFQKHISPLKNDSDCLQQHPDILCDANKEVQLDNLCSLKSEFDEKLDTKKCFPVVDESHIDVQKDHTADNFNTHLPMSSPSNVEDFTKKNFTIETNFENMLDSCIKDINGIHFKQHETSEKLSNLRADLPDQEVLNEPNLHYKSNTEISNQTPPEIITEQQNILEANLDAEVSGGAEIYASPTIIKSPVSKVLSDDVTVALTSLHMEQISIKENSPSATKNFLPFKFVDKTSIDDSCVNRLNFYESVDYNHFIDSLYKLVISGDCQLDIGQNKFHLISEIFSHSFEEMFEAYCNNSIEEKLKNINISEDLALSVPENLKSKQKSSSKLSDIQVLACEYRYYLIGGKKKDSCRKPKRSKTK